MRLHGAREQTGVFFSKVDFFSVSHVTTYTTTIKDRTYITGMKVRQGEASAILGEATDEEKTFSLGGDVERISVYYEPESKTKYRINGLRFRVGPEPDSFIGVGMLKGVHDEVKLGEVGLDFNPLFYLLHEDCANGATGSTHTPLGLQLQLLISQQHAHQARRRVRRWLRAPRSDGHASELTFSRAFFPKFLFFPFQF